MREIKFRALIQYKGKDPVWIYYKPLVIPHAFFDDDFSEDRPKIIVKNLENTGLKDKNGKEIYEGDIVDGRRYYRPALYGRREVKQDHDGCWNLSRWRNEVEVIGNIYENPELLI